MSIHQQAQDFLYKANELGMIDEINQRIEERNNTRRNELLIEIKQLPTEAQAGLPKLAKAASDAQRELELAEEALKRAERKYRDANLQSYGAHNQFHGRREKLEAEAMKLAPKFLMEACADLDYLWNSVRHNVHVVISHHSTFFGKEKREKSNWEEVGALMTEIDEAKKRILAMALEMTDIEKLKAEAAQICHRIQLRSFELGVDQREFNTRHDKVAREEKGLALRDKNAAARRQQMSTLSI